MTTYSTENDPLGVWPDAETVVRGELLSSSATEHSMPLVQVNEPMSVFWQGVEYSVAHWDISGLCLQSPIPLALTPGRGRVVDFFLLIGQGETRLQMRVSARGAPGDETGLKYQFIAMGRAQSELLHRVVTTAVSRQELSLTQLLNDTQDTRKARQESVEQVQASRGWFQMGLAGLVIVGAGGALFNSMSTVTARFAAVTAAAASVSVPATGMVTNIAVTANMPVTVGSVLARVRPADFDSQLDQTGTRIRALEAEQADLYARQRSLQAVGAHDSQARHAERALREQALKLAKTRLDMERGQLAALNATGLPTFERQQARARQRALTLAAEQEVMTADAALRAFDIATELGAIVPAGGTLSMNSLTPEALDLRLAHIADEIARAYAREDDLFAGAEVISPCDCVVVQVNRSVGEWADPAQPIFVLAQEGASIIHALIQSEDARGVSQGDRAIIRLADGQEITGHVGRLNYDAAWAGFAGLSHTIFAADRYARVEILPDMTISAPVGMTAQVRLKTAFLSGLMTKLGF